MTPSFAQGRERWASQRHLPLWTAVPARQRLATSSYGQRADQQHSVHAQGRCTLCMRSLPEPSFQTRFPVPEKGQLHIPDFQAENYLGRNGQETARGKSDTYKHTRSPGLEKGLGQRAFPGQSHCTRGTILAWS